MSNGNGHQSEILDRLPPSDVSSEMALIGSLILRGRACDDTFGQLEAEDFYQDANGRLFSAMHDLWVTGQNFDLQALCARLREQESYDLVGGGSHIAKCVHAAGTGSHAAFHRRIIRNLSVRRSVITAAMDIIRDGWDTQTPLSEYLDSSGSAMFEALDRGLETQSNLIDVRQALSDAMERMDRQEDPAEIPTGYDKLDEQMGGLRRKQLTIIGARPSHGKTALAIKMATETARAGYRTLFISLEMSSDELADRILSQEAIVNLHRMRRNTLNTNERQGLISAANRLMHMPLKIDDQPRQGVTQINSVIRALTRGGGVDVVFLDYLQLVSPENPKDSRHEQLGKMTRLLKIIARETDCAVVALSQVSRQAGDANRPPKLSEMRESGNIEQDADVVLFVYRRDQDDLAFRAQVEAGADADDRIIVAKQRNGPTGTIKVLFHKQRAAFVELAEQRFAGEEDLDYRGQQDDLDF